MSSTTSIVSSIKLAGGAEIYTGTRIGKPKVSILTSGIVIVGCFYVLSDKETTFTVLEVIGR
jgi:hypothetical protein